MSVCNLTKSKQKVILSKYTFLIIICSIFVQSSDWLVATAISHYYLLNFCSKLWLAAAISHYYLLNFRSKLWLATAKKLMSEIEWVKGILQTKIYNGEIHEYLKHPYSHSNATLEKFISITRSAQINLNLCQYFRISNKKNVVN